MARRLRITLENCWQKSIEEGDASNFDAGVLEEIVNLYWSTMMIHYDPTSEDFSVVEQIVKFLLKNMVTRITRLFGDLWGEVHGGVPSGAFNTSHMDSWIMLLYLCFFFVWTVHHGPEEMRENLEEHFIRYICVIVYGDDHAYQRGEGKYSSFFTIDRFAEFMQKYFGVTIRDRKTGMSFCSKTKDGFIIEMGLTILKHQFVINPEKSIGQATFLPFRESPEFIMRAVWGRETRPRDAVDVMLSLIGHAYGTYASNRDAWERMGIFYGQLLKRVGSIEDVRRAIRNRLTNDDVKKLRQLGITESELYSGYPSWETLIMKNVYDPVYQDNARAFYTVDTTYAEW